MNSALLKEREEFRKRAMAVPVVENKKRKVEEPAKKAAAPKPATEKVKTKNGGGLSFQSDICQSSIFLSYQNPNFLV